MSPHPSDLEDRDNVPQAPECIGIANTFLEFRFQAAYKQESDGGLTQDQCQFDRLFPDYDVPRPPILEMQDTFLLGFVNKTDRFPSLNDLYPSDTCLY